VKARGERNRKLIFFSFVVNYWTPTYMRVIGIRAHAPRTEFDRKNSAREDDLQFSSYKNGVIPILYRCYCYSEKRLVYNTLGRIIPTRKWQRKAGNTRYHLLYTYIHCMDIDVENDDKSSNIYDSQISSEARIEFTVNFLRFFQPIYYRLTECCELGHANSDHYITDFNKKKKKKKTTKQ